MATDTQRHDCDLQKQTNNKQFMQIAHNNTRPPNHRAPSIMTSARRTKSKTILRKIERQNYTGEDDEQQLKHVHRPDQ